MRVVARIAVALGLVCWTLGAGAQQALTVASLDDAAGRAIRLPAWWFEAPLPPGTHAPAVVLLHGCGGPYAAGRQRLSGRLLEMSQRLNAMGIHALVTDSLSPRGERELCTQKLGTRAVTQSQRRLDALGALQWLAERPEVDAARLGLIGWSNGGSAVLAATNLRKPPVREAKARASLAVAFYPGCQADLASGYDAVAPLLILAGAEDDWTPAGPCEALAGAAAGAPVRTISYPGAYHGFDGTAPLRHLKNVPNGVNPGQGVHVGAHAPAREAARIELAAFLARHWGIEGKP
jgi:dienelactone hydrolase